MGALEIVADILDVVKSTPAIVAAVQEALQKKGYTVAEVEAIFAEVTPPDQLGIDPNHPFADEPAAAPAAAPQVAQASPPAPTGIQSAPHITARPGPLIVAPEPQPLFSELPPESTVKRPTLPQATPPPAPPFGRAR